MRTTLTIDDDVAAQLDRLRRDRDESLKRIVNEALRRGLQELNEPVRPRKPFQTRSVNLGKPLIDNLDCIGTVLEAVEDERFR
ncbi:MAG: CopG family transcriptional regulator [Stellaceae bacterium]